MKILPLLVLVALTVSACGTATGGSGGSAGEQVELDGRTFLSTAVTENGAAKELVADSRVRLSFEEGRLSAHSGCNTMNGDYTIEDGALSVGPLMMTQMGCQDGLAEQDTWLSELLSDGPAVALDGDELVLTAGSTVLTLADRVVADPDRALVGEWAVESLLSADAVSSVPSGAEATLTFEEGGNLLVAPGCNRGSGTFTEGEGTLTVGSVALTRMACEGPRGELEKAVLEVLNAGELTMSIEASQLTLTAGDLGLTLRAKD